MRRDVDLRPFASLTTPHVADACLRAGVPLRIARTGIRPLCGVPRGSSEFLGESTPRNSEGPRNPEERSCIAGPAVPVRHFGSVDVFLEAIHDAPRGGVLVIANDGRVDEGCVGDLIALEAKMAGLAGIVIDGLHRDSAELRVIGLPLFSYGCLAAGPQRLDAGAQSESIAFAGVTVSRDDVVFGDEDGVLFVAADDVRPVLEIASAIATREREQAAKIARGTSLYEQLRFAEYVAKREADAAYTFRKHLREVGGAVEE